MTFGDATVKDYDELNLRCWRYETEAEARAGHETVVAEYRVRLNLTDADVTDRQPVVGQEEGS